MIVSSFIEVRRVDEFGVVAFLVEVASSIHYANVRVRRTIVIGKDAHGGSALLNKLRYWHGSLLQGPVRGLFVGNEQAKRETMEHVKGVAAGFGFGARHF